MGRDGSRPTLPYTTSGHTILKKSSTDPTSDRSAGTSASTTIKHTTFCDVVTVVDSEVGEVHEERLREVDDDDIEEAEQSPSETAFFLSPADADLAPSPSPSPTQTGSFLIPANPDLAVSDEVDAGSVLDSAVQRDAIFEEGLTKDVSSVGLMSVFSTAARPKSESSEPNPEEPKKTSTYLRTTKHVKLVDLMAQIRGDDGGERS